MERYINDDAKITKGAIAYRISEEDFIKKVCEATKTHLDESDYEDYLEDVKDGYNPFYSAIGMLINRSDRIGDDKDIEVDHENYDFEPYSHMSEESREFLDLHTIDGLTFCGIITGGDWEHPVFMILYWDGEDIRAYIPRRGNLVNLDTMTAFGSEGDVMDPFWGRLSERAQRLRSEYKEKGLMPPWNPEEDEDEEDEVNRYINWSAVYVKKYGYETPEDDYIDVPYNWSAIKEDIFAHIEIKG